MGRALGEFWEGLTRATAWSIASVLAFAILELAVCCAFVDERLLARLPSGFLKQSDRDDRARVTVDACHARFGAAKIEALDVFYVGSSTARMVLEDADAPAPIERALAAAAGEPVRFWNLTADGESIEEYLLIADHVRAGRRGVFIAPVSDSRHDHFERAEGKRRKRSRELLGLDVAGLGGLAEILGEAPAHATGVFFLDHVDFFAARRTALARLQPPPRPPSEAHRRGDVARYVAMARKMDAEPGLLPVLDKHVRMLRFLARTLRARGVDLIVLESPVAPAFNAAKPHLRAACDAKIADFVSELDVTYWDLNDEAGLTDADFIDPVHVGEEAARARYQAVFLAHLGAWLADRR